MEGHISPTVAQMIAVSNKTGWVLRGSKTWLASLKEAGLPISYHSHERKSATACSEAFGSILGIWVFYLQLVHHHGHGVARQIDTAGEGATRVIAWMYFSIALSQVFTVDYIITYLMFRNRYCPAHPLFRNRHLVIMLLIHQYFAKFCTISAKLVSISLSAPKSYHQNSKCFTFLIALCFIFHWNSIDSVFYIFILLY
jgi:hypothetical protein